MDTRLIRQALAALFVFTCWCPGSASAGECRAAVRPLLLTQTPDAAEVARVQGICTAEAGNGDAHVAYEATYQLALLELGVAGRFEPAHAIELIRAAAIRNVPEAQYWLAWQSEAGPLLPHDSIVARGWYERAAGNNHKLAIRRLAEAYEKGELGLPVDTAQAARYHARESRCLRAKAARS